MVARKNRNIRREEEKFGARRARKKTKAQRKTELKLKKPVLRKNTIRNTWKKLTRGWTGAIFYVFLGIVLALLARQALAFALSTEMPVVAVVSTSMQHDHVEQTHYQWLDDRMGYSEDYIKSWSIPTGFLVGDMPVVQGSGDYEVGDVVVYSVSNQNFPIIHRIIKINEDNTYQTKGDNNLNQLPYEFKVHKEQIYGKVLFIIPKLGYFKVMLTNVLGIG